MDEGRLHAALVAVALDPRPRPLRGEGHRSPRRALRSDPDRPPRPRAPALDAARLRGRARAALRRLQDDRLDGADVPAERPQHDARGVPDRPARGHGPRRRDAARRAATRVVVRVHRLHADRPRDALLLLAARRQAPLLRRGARGPARRPAAQGLREDGPDRRRRRRPPASAGPPARRLRPRLPHLAARDERQPVAAREGYLVAKDDARRAHAPRLLRRPALDRHDRLDEVAGVRAGPRARST